MSLVGVVTRGTPLLLLVSFCENGSLLSYLREAANTVDVTTKLRMAMEIARGMAHLAQNHIVHRDLAARNVLLDSTLTAKIADFGLSRGIMLGEDYYKSNNGAFPIRWTAPDAVETSRFNESSDVWSFAVTLVELFNDGGRPYAGLGNAEVMTKVAAGHRDPKPASCPQNVYVGLWYKHRCRLCPSHERAWPMRRAPSEGKAGGLGGGGSSSRPSAWRTVAI